MQRKKVPEILFGFVTLVGTVAAVFVFAIMLKNKDFNLFNYMTNQKEDEKNENIVAKDISLSDQGIHTYKLCVSDCTWKQAFRKAKKKGGYLVRINSEEELEALKNQIKEEKLTDIFFKIGGRREGDSSDYYWVDENNNLYGEALNESEYWTSSIWKNGEPSFSNAGIKEKYLEMIYDSNSHKGRCRLKDIPNDMLKLSNSYSGKLGYIVEYE